MRSEALSPAVARSKGLRVGLLDNLFVVLIAVAMSCMFEFLSFFSFISGGFRIILCAVTASALGAWLMPVPQEETKEKETEEQEALNG